MKVGLLALTRGNQAVISLGEGEGAGATGSCREGAEAAGCYGQIEMAVLDDI